MLLYQVRKPVIFMDFVSFRILTRPDMEFRNFLNFVLSALIIYALVSLVPFIHTAFMTFSVAVVGMKLAEWLMNSTRTVFLYKTVSPENKAIFITGCDSGFGNALAARMARIGYKVFAGCLNPDGDGAKQLLGENRTHDLVIVPLDVTKDESIQAAKEFVSKHLNKHVLWAVVNNAGIGHAGEIDWTPFEEFQRIYDVNAAGTLRVTKAFLPLIKKSKGRIINNTSNGGHFIYPGYVGYCMSKSAAIALTTGLRIELAKWGIKAISIEPFFYVTPLTRTNTACELADSTWEKAPSDIREEYGEYYKEAFKDCIAKLLSRCNRNSSEVVDCFEDAITAEEPLPTYFPSSTFDKFGIKFLMLLPTTVREGYQRLYLEGGVAPAALQKEHRKFN